MWRGLYVVNLTIQSYLCRKRLYFELEWRQICIFNMQRKYCEPTFSFNSGSWWCNSRWGCWICWVLLLHSNLVRNLLPIVWLKISLTYPHIIRQFLFPEPDMSKTQRQGRQKFIVSMNTSNSRKCRINCEMWSKIFQESKIPNIMNVWSMDNIMSSFM